MSDQKDGRIAPVPPSQIYTVKVYEADGNFLIHADCHKWTSVIDAVKKYGREAPLGTKVVVEVESLATR